MRFYLLLLIFVAVSGAAQAAPPQWTIIPDQSTITFSGIQEGVPFQGKFGAFKGEIVFDENDLAASHAKILIETATANTGNPDRDQELPRADWFNSGVFPQAQFVTTAFKKTGEGYIAEGKLIIRNREHPVSLPFTLTITENNQAGPSVAHAVGQITLNRLDYDVGTGQWRNTSSVGESVQVMVNILAQRSDK